MVFDGTQPPITNSEPFTMYSSSEWDAIDNEFSAIVSLVHYRLVSDEILTSEAAEIYFFPLFKAHLKRYDAAQEPAAISSCSKVIHRTKWIERKVQGLREMKNSARKNMRQNPSEFHNINKSHDKALKTLNCNVTAQNLQTHEKAFKSNHWVYFKKLCAFGTSCTSPACTPDFAYKYFSNITSESNHYQSLPLWIDEIWHAPDPEDLLPFTYLQ